MLNRVTFIPGAVLSIRGTAEQESGSEGAGRPGPPSRWHLPEGGPHPVRPAHGLRQDQ
jgi:hypothetical protein